ncbi:MAG: outer membrane protein assembly factor BamB family protein, partial [Planctomycetota bacterium]
MCKMSGRRGRAAPGAWAMLLAAGLCLVALGGPVHGGEFTRAIEARRLRGGVILLVNAGDAVYDEAAATGCTVRGLETDPDKVEALRKRFLTREVYGKISVSAFDGETLPCIDGLVNVVLAERARVRMDEVMRVLAPGGTALVRTEAGWETRVKPWPPEMGEWHQYLCNADNNGVTADSAGPPERLQWTGGSRYGRLKVTMPSVTSMVTAGGRIFTVEDMATTEAGGLPKRYVLLARDAFNGCELWRHPLRDWDKERCAPVKDISVQLQRRVVAVGEKVYCTTGFDGPVAVFDGATGAIISTFEGTENTREFAHADGVIFGIRGDPFATRVSPARTKLGNLEIKEVTLYARNAEDGNVLWRAAIDGKAGYIGGTLSIRGEYLCYVTRERLHCRDSRTGRELWSRDYPYFADMPRKGVYAIRYNNSSPTIVMTERRLFVAELDRVRAYSITDGALLWSGATECNYTKNGDLFHARGLVWNGYLQGLDPATGEVRRRLEQKVTGPMSHDRCYRNRITHRYYINSKSGGADLVALDGSGEFPSPWIRATCGLSITPSYGRLYSSPYVCACEIGAMLLGFNCTYTASRDRGEVFAVRPEPRLVRGKAHGAAAGGPAATGADWPTYRHDNARSGATASAIPERLDVVWKASLPGIPTAPVVAGGLLFVAVRDMHTLFALDRRTGRRRWRFTADGP